ncbi:MAG: hypothetical protein ACFBZ8_10870 [Opitutales bacterium]
MPAPADHAPALLLEASGPVVQVGLGGADGWLGYARSEAPALESLTPLIAAVLKQAGLKLDDIGCFVYDEGPGTLLGLRLAAMTFRTWKALPMHRTTPVFAFRSVEAAAASLLAKGTKPPFGLVTEAGLGKWVLSEKRGEGSPGALEVVDAERLAAYPHPLYHLAQRKQWKPLPCAATVFNLDLEALPVLLSVSQLSHSVDQPIPLRPVVQDYVKWSGQRHRS